jgi:hypothetical protein
VGEGAAAPILAIHGWQAHARECRWGDDQSKRPSKKPRIDSKMLVKKPTISSQMLSRFIVLIS